MSDPAKNRDTGRWWEPLGLRLVSSAAGQVLRAHPPAGFGDGDGNEPVGLAELEGMVRRAEGEAEQRRRREAVDLHGMRRSTRIAADADFETAYELHDGDAGLEHGRWIGFTNAEAAAWCWNLFQYEPRGFVPPGSMLRTIALAQLRAGGLPEVFDYPERARALAASGMSPRAYRHYREALGSPVFDPEDVYRPKRCLPRESQ